MITEIKHSILEKMLSEGDTVRIVVNMKVFGVLLPTVIGQEHHMMLDIGFNTPISCKLELTESNIYCVLSFSRTPFSCIVPWASIWQIAFLRDLERAIVFPADFLVNQGPQSEQRKTIMEPTKKIVGRKLFSIDGGKK